MPMMLPDYIKGKSNPESEGSGKSWWPFSIVPLLGLDLLLTGVLPFALSLDMVRKINTSASNIPNNKIDNWIIQSEPCISALVIRIAVKAAAEANSTPRKLLLIYSD